MAIPAKIVCAGSEYERIRLEHEQRKFHQRQLEQMAQMQNNPYVGQLNQAAQMMNQAAQCSAPAPFYLDRRLLLLL